MTEEEINDRENKIKLFEHIADQVCKALEQFKDEPGPKTNIMNDFLTDEFVNKNIRVRPTSGKIVDDQKTSKGDQHSNYRIDMNEDNNDQMEIIEMEDQRKKVKMNYEARVKD